MAVDDPAPNLDGRQTSRDLGLRFERLIADIFKAEGFLIEELTNDLLSVRPDLVILSPSGTRAVVEIKLIRSRIASTNILLKAGDILDRYVRAVAANAAILVVGATVGGSAAEALKAAHPSLILYDLAILVGLASKHGTLLNQLETLIREASPFSEPASLDQTSTHPLEDVQRPRQPRPEPPDATGRPSIGSAICAELRAIPLGKKGAVAFEEKATEALKYIFAEDLTAWATQKSSDTGMSRYDLIGRVGSIHDFWQTVSSQFHSRYIVFEFKNYSSKIKQGQIYTTERYLHLNALRGTAFVISRKGADSNAIKAAKGALREAGKLIVLLDLDKICRMLDLRDKAEDHNSVLVETLDDFLIRLER